MRFGALFQRPKPAVVTRERPKTKPPVLGGRLTKRECQVLQAVADGLRSNEVADRLYVGKRTVDFHLANAFRKLGVRNRTGAVLKAARMGLIRLEIPGL